MTVNIGQLGQAPEHGQNGSIMHQESVSGRSFIAVFGGEALGYSVTMTAGQQGSFINYVEFLRENGTTIPHSEAIVFFHTTYYLDTYSEAGWFKIGSDDVITIGENVMRLADDNTLDSTHVHIANLYNADSSTHTIYQDIEIKLIWTLPIR